ncbi:hypothetical protein RFI_35119 [Reticulomyxa filosa]|uniref:Uncharacterized protein n=1 Tax=Reticulomyxa filosa TaxID=46433 RepID=X6LME2_RETFI|nr:hypothetical protein RFI_35119 [Reticulomyxa filosa]|eukprot:ETO02317.1 hypothetical protein RFI_35119 [Reticulomyxa filosa]
MKRAKKKAGQNCGKHEEGQTSKLVICDFKRDMNDHLSKLLVQRIWIQLMKYNYKMSIGRHLCFVSADLTIQLWDIETSSTLQTFKEYSGVIRCVDFSFRRENGDNSISGGNEYNICSELFDRTICVWDKGIDFF